MLSFFNTLFKKIKMQVANRALQTRNTTLRKTVIWVTEDTKAIHLKIEKSFSTQHLGHSHGNIW
jgi:hypothetical protein